MAEALVTSREYLSALLHIWSRIRDELALHQDLASDGLCGQVVNPVSGAVHTRDTAFAALVFATEYRRTEAKQWLLRAKDALDSLYRMDLYSGLDEPIWNRYGWHYNKGSLATTGMLLDAVWQAMTLLEMWDCYEEQWQNLFRYLESCMIGAGLFAHNAVKPGTSPVAIQNTTAIALYLLEYAISKAGSVDASVLRERDSVWRALRNGQRIDGFWPYVYPGTLQQSYFRFPFLRPLVKRLPVVGEYFFKNGDVSVFFGDAVHHCLVFYYYVKSALLVVPKRSDSISVVQQAWQWIYDHLVDTPDGGLRFDFDWEPRPYIPRYCNFRETSTYFLIIAALPLLAKVGVIGNEYRSMALRLLVHIENNLLQTKNTFPGIKPYEGPIEVLRNILPRVGESVAWKGSCLCQFVLEEL